VSPAATRPGEAPVPQGARDQVARLLTLVPWLHRQGPVRVEEAAAALGVPPAQLVRDLKVLLMCGLPGGYPDDLIDVDLDALEGPEADGTIKVSNADYLARPLRLTATEASALVVALRAVRSGADPATLEVVDRTLAKLEAAAAGAVPAAVVEAGADPHAAAALAALRRTLQDAVDRRRQVRLTYWSPTRDELSERTVDPRGLVAHGGHDYLDAWCHAAEAPRTFRLDRVRDAEVLDAAVVSEPAPPREPGDRGVFEPGAAARTATLVLEPRAHWVVEYYPVEEVRRLDDGRLEVDLLVGDERWLTRLLLRTAPHARVVAPEEFTRSFTDAARSALGLYP